VRPVRSAWDLVCSRSDVIAVGGETNARASRTHVGIAISPTQMIDAPHTGADVEITGVGRYLAASRPTARTVP
jgi:hypothetical protein